MNSIEAERRLQNDDVTKERRHCVERPVHHVAHAVCRQWHHAFEEPACIGVAARRRGWVEPALEDAVADARRRPVGRERRVDAAKGGSLLIDDGNAELDRGDAVLLIDGFGAVADQWDQTALILMFVD